MVYPGEARQSHHDPASRQDQEASAAHAPEAAHVPRSQGTMLGHVASQIGPALLQHKLERRAQRQTHAPPFPADGSIPDAREYLKRHKPRSDDPRHWSPDQMRAFNVLAHAFGRGHQHHHKRWHDRHGPGGTEGPGSGMAFLTFHHQMMAELEAYTGVRAPRGWNPATPVPAELKDETRQHDNPHIERPDWLTLNGKGTRRGDREFHKSVRLMDPDPGHDDPAAGETFKKLGDFEDPDELGRALGESGYHAAAHTNMGGDMASPATSPLDPAFTLWHGHIDELLREWLHKTENGRKWAKRNPRSPLLHFGPMKHHAQEPST